MVKRRYQEPKGLFVRPQTNLEPIIGNFYGSAPIDPTDCNIYPDSPFCGGNPISGKMINIVPQIVNDECNLGVQVNASLAIIKLPPVQILYRNPDCRPPAIPPSSETIGGIPIPGGLTDDDEVLVFSSYWFNQIGTLFPDGREQVFGMTIQQSLSGIEFDNKNILGSLENASTIPPTLDYYNVVVTYAFNSIEHYDDGTTQLGTGEVKFYQIVDLAGAVLGQRYTLITSSLPNYEIALRFYAGHQIMTVGEFKTSGISNFSTIVRTPIEGFPGYAYINDDARNYILYPLKSVPPLILPPPPPDNMSCNCCPSIQNQDELLRLILKRIGTPKKVTIFDEDMDREGAQQADKNQETLFNAVKIATDRTEVTNKLIGIENFPVNVPDTVVVPHKDGIFAQIFDFIDGDKTRNLKSLTELVAWQAEQDNAVLGQFHQVIEFEQDFDGDGNAVKETVVLPNVAESLKELILLMVQLANADGTKLHALVKILAEVNNIKVQLFKTMQTVIDIQDYLDYPTNTKDVTVPLSCTLKLDSNNDLNNFFEDSKGTMTYEDWDGSNSLHDNMLDLLQIASMLRSQLYQRD